MRWNEIDSQVCSVAKTLAIIGDRWTLLILRDCFLGVTRFSEFQQSLEVTKHRLSDRLNKLVEAGILKKQVYDSTYGRFEYKLTRKGLDLHPVLMTLVAWGDKWTTDEDGAPLEYVHRDCQQTMKPELTCEHCHEAVGPFSTKVKLGPGILKKHARGENIKGSQIHRKIKD